MNPEAIQRARNNLGAYYLAQNPEFQYVEFQQDFMAPALHKVAQHEIEALMILMPFRHSKTELATKNFIPWLFGRWPKRNNMLISYSDKFAKRFGSRILELVKSDVHKEIFPDCVISPFARSGSYFLTTQGGAFFSAGFGGAITGQGVDGVMVIDDPIKNIEEVKSSAIMGSIMDSYHSAVSTRLEGASILVCTTRWAKNDFVDRVLAEEGEVHEGGRWTVLKLPAQAGDDDPLGRSPGEFLWPERLGEKWYEQHKRRRIWNAMCQQEPQSDRGKFFKREWLCHYPNRVKPGKFPAYMLTDPGKSKGNEHDRTAIGVFVATPEKRILLVDAVLARLDPDERAREHIRLIRKWHPRRWLYEEYGMVNDKWYLDQAVKKAGIHVYPITVGRRGPRHMLSKDTRIEGLIPDFREGRIWLPDPKIPFASMKMDDADEEISIIQYFVEQEYCEYEGEGSIDHEDMLDMMSRLHEPELNLAFPAAENDDVSREISKRRIVRAGSWEAVL